MSSGDQIRSRTRLDMSDESEIKSTSSTESSVTEFSLYQTAIELKRGRFDNMACACKGVFDKFASILKLCQKK